MKAALLETKKKKRELLIGLAWTVLGIAGILYSILNIFRGLNDVLGAFPKSLIAFVPSVIFCSIIIEGGTGRLAKKRWAKLITVVISPILLLYGLAITISLIFSNIVQFEWIRAFVIMVALVPLSLYTLIVFVKNRSVK